MEMTIETRLKEIIASCGKGVKVEDLHEETDLVKDLKFDSINIIQLVAELECGFDIEIDDYNLELEKLSKYKTLRAIVEEKLSEC